MIMGLQVEATIACCMRTLPQGYGPKHAAAEGYIIVHVVQSFSPQDLRREYVCKGPCGAAAMGSMQAVSQPFSWSSPERAQHFSQLPTPMIGHRASGEDCSHHVL